MYDPVLAADALKDSRRAQSYEEQLNDLRDRMQPEEMLQWVPNRRGRYDAQVYIPPRTSDIVGSCRRTSNAADRKFDVGLLDPPRVVTTSGN